MDDDLGHATEKVRYAVVDGRGRNPCRNADLRRSVTISQIRVAYGCRLSFEGRETTQSTVVASTVTEYSVWYLQLYSYT